MPLDGTLAPARAPSPRVGEEVAAPEHEAWLAVSAVAAGNGALVWVGEPGCGRSTLLQNVVHRVEARFDARQVVVVRTAGRWVTRSSAPETAPRGTGLESVVAQLERTNDGDVPERLRRALDAGGPDESPSPEVAAVALAELVGASCAGRCLVVVADDVDRMDAFSRSALAALLVQRRVPVVLLATAEDAGSSPPCPLTVRAVPHLVAREALELLTADRRLPVAPVVAARLAEVLGGNAAAIVQVGRLLSAEQLAGSSALPVPLPAVVAVQRCFAVALDPLGEADRTTLLLAALSLVGRLDVLLRAAAQTMEGLVEGPLAPHLVLGAGRCAFRDDRLRSLVLATASPAERGAAHARLADAHVGLAVDADAALWHRAQASPTADASLAGGLCGLAERLLAQGDAAVALEVAREAGRHATEGSDEHAVALGTSGRAALAGGWVHDAARDLRQAWHQAGSLPAAWVLPDLLVALTLVDGQVPDGLVDQEAARLAAGWAEGRSREGRGARGGDPGDEAGGDGTVVAHLVRARATAARLHAERGDAAAAERHLAAARRLPAAGARAALEVALAEAWLRLFDARRDGDVPVEAGTSPDPAHRALAAVCTAVEHVRQEDPEGALRALGTADAGLSAGAAPDVLALLRVARGLVLAWSGDLRGSREELARAAFELPVGLPLAGLAVALARRLDLLVTGEVRIVASSLEATSAGPSARELRVGRLTDRALAAFFAGRRTEAAGLLDLVEERPLEGAAALLPLLGAEAVSAWAAAGRPDEARRAGERARARAALLPVVLRRAALVRTRVVLADAGSVAALRGEVARLAPRLCSPFERARLELELGAALARCGERQAARAHLHLAAELFEGSGAAAWARLAAAELGRLAPRGATAAAVGEARAGVGADSGAAGDATTPGGRRDGLPGDEPEGGVGDVPEMSSGTRDLHRERWAAGLTERELGVALLVAEGASNRAVAERLFLSVRTVEVHLGRAFRKLGVRSRVELALLVHRGWSGSSAR